MSNETADLDRLRALISAAPDEDHVVIQFIGATWSNTSLELKLRVSVVGSEPQIWEVHCENVLAYVLRDGGIFWLEFTDDHPLLWDFQHDHAMAFFRGAPGDANAAVGALYEAHQGAVDSSISFARYLNVSDSLALSKLLAEGNGLLARGPAPILTVYKEALQPHGVDVNICSHQRPSFWDGTNYREVKPEDNIKVLLLSSSYVIGTGWMARQEFNTEEPPVRANNTGG